MEAFEAQVSGMVAQNEALMTAVVKQSTQELFRRANHPRGAGGLMPVDTGNLRASFVSSLNGGSALSSSTNYVMTIAQYELGDTIEGVWTANYAPHVNYGTYKMSPRGFMTIPAAEWPDIVAGVLSQVRQ